MSVQIAFPICVKLLNQIQTYSYIIARFFSLPTLLSTVFQSVRVHFSIDRDPFFSTRTVRKSPFSWSIQLPS